MMGQIQLVGWGEDKYTLKNFSHTKLRFVSFILLLDFSWSFFIVLPYLDQKNFDGFTCCVFFFCLLIS